MYTELKGNLSALAQRVEKLKATSYSISSDGFVISLKIKNPDKDNVFVKDEFNTTIRGATLIHRL